MLGFLYYFFIRLDILMIIFCTFVDSKFIFQVAKNQQHIKRNYNE